MVCWKCGAALAGVPFPLARLADCPACHAELHACRMCTHYNPRVEGKCNETRAEEVREKERANFCDWFRPRPAAYAPPAPKGGEAKTAPDSLFGASGAAAAPATRDALQDLFRKPEGKP